MMKAVQDSALASERRAILYLRDYLMTNPISHSLWRGVECELFAQQELITPVLDVGCGDGVFASILLRHKHGVAPLSVGIDLSFTQARQARQSRMYQDVIVADVTRLPFADQAFATVLSNSALEHIPRIQVALSEIKRVLRVDGVLYFTVPTPYLHRFNIWASWLRRLNLNWLAGQINRLRTRLMNEYHYFEVASACTLVESAGLQWKAGWYYLPETSTRLLSFFFLPDLVLWLLRVLVGRWLFVPFLHCLSVDYIQVPLLRHYLTLQAPTGAGLFVIATPKG